MYIIRTYIYIVHTMHMVSSNSWWTLLVKTKAQAMWNNLYICIYILYIYIYI